MYQNDTTHTFVVSTSTALEQTLTSQKYQKFNAII